MGAAIVSVQTMKDGAVCAPVLRPKLGSSECGNAGGDRLLASENLQCGGKLSKDLERSSDSGILCWYTNI